VKAHLQRDFGGTGAIGGVESMAETAQMRKPFRQFDHRRMGAAGQHDMLDTRQLIDDRRVDAGLA
jgi:hypothetical protein